MPSITVASVTEYSSEKTVSTIRGRVRYIFSQTGMQKYSDHFRVSIRCATRLQLCSTKKRSVFYYKIGPQGNASYTIYPSDLVEEKSSTGSSTTLTSSWSLLSNGYTTNVTYYDVPIDFDNEQTITRTVPQLTASFGPSAGTIRDISFAAYTASITISRAKTDIIFYKNAPDGVDAGDISVPSTKHVFKGDTLPDPGAATDKTETYDFVGWRINSATGSLITFPYTLTSTDDITLYASWKKSTKSELSVKENDAWQKGDANARASNGEWVTADRVYVRKKNQWL